MPAARPAAPSLPRTERLPGPPGLSAPGGLAEAVEAADPDGLAAAARAYREYVRRDPAGDIDAWAAGSAVPGGAAGLFRALHRRDPAAALRLAEGAAAMPAAGDEVAGFRLIRELGRGAFGRVFLAEQADLAGRPVVLKVSLGVRAEARTIARLFHPNVVPIYSVHQAGALQAVCMPYCGATTLADVVARFRGDTLPESGQGLVTLLTVSVSHGPPVSAPAPAPPAPRPPATTAALEVLGRLSYVDAVLWIGGRLADALAHAHDQGVLHRDLKPANVLLTDEGQPLLLDFNLATDTRLAGVADAARLGGTLPYMPPEHIKSFAGQPRAVDARGDVYALGVILFELLTGELPFPVYPRATPDQLRQMVADRQVVPRLRDRNPAVSPAVESIVRTCLGPDPADRYPSAHALREDLERQLTHRPLRYARDPSPAERVGKWARRHPRLSSGAVLGPLAALLLAVAVGAAAFERERRLGLEANETLRAFREDARRVPLVLAGLPGDDRRPLAEAADRGRQALARYPAPDDPGWDRAVRRLSADERRRLREEVGVLLLLVAHANGRAGDDPRAAAEALRLTEQAAGCFPANAVPPVVWTQRAELLARLGRPATDPGQAGPAPDSVRDLTLAGWDQARHGRFRDAVPLLEAATRKDPSTYWAWFLLGRCHDGVSRDADAVACYGTCLALQPDADAAWFNRGLAHLRRGDFKSARSDFDRCLELRPGLADAYYDRALAKEAVGDRAGAEADLTAALDRRVPPTRVYLARARVRDRLGDRAGAAADRAEGMAREPADEAGWAARGFARLGSDPKAALADFNRSLGCNPAYLPALVNKAHVLADRLARPADAVAVLDRAIESHPCQPALWAGRAVYRARLGRRAEAHADAEEALRLSGDPATRYQVAGAYALTSKDHPEDRKEAFRLLGMALRQGYGFEHLEADPELAPVRQLPEFKELVAAARALRAGGR